MDTGFKEFDREVFKAISEVELTDEGTFKYILIHVKHKKNQRLLEFVRGFNDLDYHANILSRFIKEFNARNIVVDGQVLKTETNVDVSCPGGGRVVHSSRLSS